MAEQSESPTKLAQHKGNGKCTQGKLEINLKQVTSSDNIKLLTSNISLSNTKQQETQVIKQQQNDTK